MSIEWLWAAVSAAADPGSERATGPRVWRYTLPHLDSGQLDEAVRLGWLTSIEREAANRKAGAELQSRFGGRRVLRRLVVAASLGAAPTEVAVEARCPRCGDTSHGRPHVVAPVPNPPHLSTSCIDDRVVIAVGSQSLGIDIESADRADHLWGRRETRAIAGWEQVAPACPPNASMVDVWSALEALSKTTGRGLLASPNELKTAIATHRLTWIPDAPGRVICVAVAEPAPVVSAIEVAGRGASGSLPRPRRAVGINRR
ncbi:4'-phosphopantetheinyl transferase family protein [Microbacterium sp.]|uniref:4'-phosphopantetheinyl transferase family protein n=1 Tax=Microbacterium sp. TaxID=51671 RepID=UPI003A949FC7